MTIRIGYGFDVHRFEEGRELWLGGIKIDHKGLAGHSDADVLIHSVIDALLGAAALGDIGEFFPDTDPQYKNIRSTVLLEMVMESISNNGWIVENIDSVVICETPKLISYKKEIRENLAKIIKISSDRIMIKGKTTEKLGFTGRGEGIASTTVALLKRRKD